MSAKMEEVERSSRVERSSESAHLDQVLARFGIDTALIGVPKLSRILGIATSTIYAYMRSGRFFIPYRLVNGSPMVRVDDLIEWYVSSEGVVQPGSSRDVQPGEVASQALMEVSSSRHVDAVPSSRGRKKAAPSSSSIGVEYNVGDLRTKEEADRAVDGLVSSVLSRLPRRGATSVD